MFIVRKKEPDLDLNPLRAYLGSIGDSLVIGEDDEAPAFFSTGFMPVVWASASYPSRRASAST